MQKCLEDNVGNQTTIHVVVFDELGHLFFIIAFKLFKTKVYTFLEYMKIVI